jgi:sugar fermentation stimulation protein A
MKYWFKEPLIEGVILKRTCQFIMWANINGEEQKVHSPTTSRIGNVALENVPCLVSLNNNPARKTKYTVEAISLDNINVLNKTWIGINQSFSNDLVSHELNNNNLTHVFPKIKEVHREVKSNNARFDFQVDNCFLEIKTPLVTLNKSIDESVKMRTFGKFASYDRLLKHVNELNLKIVEGKSAKLFIVYQYEIDSFSEYLESIHYPEVRNALEQAIKNGLQIYCLEFKFTTTDVELKNVHEITNEIIVE